MTVDDPAIPSNSPLEDEAGDIIGKALGRAGWSAADLARAIGADRERIRPVLSGAPGDEALWRSAATALRLDPAALLEIVNGRWRPALPTGRAAEVVTAIPSLVGGYEVRCYLVAEPGGGPAGLFDCGVDGDAVVAGLRRAGAALSTVFVTHGHGDHVGALREIVGAARPAEVVLPAGDARSREWRIGSMRVQRIPTPGHSADSVSYVLFDAAARPFAAFVGDLLFAGSIGRGGYDYEALIRSARRLILSLPDDVALYPGHGPSTTVGEERRHNPFLSDAADVICGGDPPR